ncbi:MAG: NACHT domain-containing protein [Phycisphaerae bacterium]
MGPDEFAELITEYLKGWKESEVARCVEERVGSFHRSNLGRWKRGEVKQPRRKYLEAVADCIRLTKTERERLLRSVGYDVGPAPGPGMAVSWGELRSYCQLIAEDHEHLKFTGWHRFQRIGFSLPLDQLFVSLQLTGGGSGEEGHGGPGMGRAGLQPRELHEALRETLQAGKHLAIIGAAGSGKTTFLRYAARMAAQTFVEADMTTARERLGVAGYIPIYLRLRDVKPHCWPYEQNDTPCDSLIREMTYAFRQAHGGGDETFFATLVKERSPRCLILLDGLDEVVVPPEAEIDAKEAREMVSEAIAALARRGAQFVATAPA